MLGMKGRREMTTDEYEKEFRRLQSLYDEIAKQRITMYEKGLWTLGELAMELTVLSREKDIELGKLILKWRNEND